MRPTSPARPPYSTLYKKIEEKVAQRDAHTQFAKVKTDTELAERVTDLSQRIKDTAKAIALSDKIDYVIADDALAGLAVTNLQGTPQQMAFRALLYATPEFDITNEIVSRLNAAYAQRPTATAPSKAP